MERQGKTNTMGQLETIQSGVDGTLMRGGKVKEGLVYTLLGMCGQRGT